LKNTAFTQSKGLTLNGGRLTFEPWVLRLKNTAFTQLKGLTLNGGRLTFEPLYKEVFT
jgi:hypothetical protein